MYLKKIDGPRAVTLGNGKKMTRADLPPADTCRWVASRKAAVVRGIKSGLISRKEAHKHWSLSPDELNEWLGAVKRHGEVALKATLVQKYRQL
ncbi:MAG: CtrA inhibitor SciP [Paracoccaceae bacterium]